MAIKLEKQTELNVCRVKVYLSVICVSQYAEHAQLLVDIYSGHSLGLFFAK